VSSTFYATIKTSAKIARDVCNRKEGRRILLIVDKWLLALRQATVDGFHDAIVDDGRRLLKHWRDEVERNQPRTIALQVGIDELELRMQEFI
jgi:hypothetical protein